MIKETITKGGASAITSDRWHVVHSRFTGDSGSPGPFARAVISEHDDRADCRKSAEALRLSLAPEGKMRPVNQRDQVFVRPPRFRSLKSARRRKVQAKRA
jgi:hypothetical protein